MLPLLLPSLALTGTAPALALVPLPLAVPVLIFGTLASTPDDGGLLSPHMLLLMAVLAVLLAIVPVAAAAALVEAEAESS